MPLTSIWAATAPAPADLPPLHDSLRADVLVIGAGFQGLSTALHLAEAGVDVVLLEARQPGHGASGRNGGQVIPGLKDDPDALDQLWGAQATDFAGSTAARLFALVDRLGIDCDAQQAGWIQAGMAQVHLPGLRARMTQWAARGAPVDWLDAAAMERATGSRSFCGGWIDRRAGKIHPLKFARGLAQAALAAGARLYGDTPVVSLVRDGGVWQARTGRGATVSADRVVLASNVYTPAGFDPDLRRATLPAHSFQVATAPLDPADLARILPQGAVVSEARRVGTYFRIGPENRLMLGGRGSFAEPQGPAAFHRIAAELTRIFGRSFAMDHHWFGRVGMTPDHRLRLLAPAPGLLAATGFNGRGVALATALGQVMAAHLAHGTPLPLPVEDRLRPLPFHGLHPVYGSLAIEYYRLRDRMDR